MAKITVQYFTLIDFSTPVGSTVVRLSPENKLPISSLEKEFQLKTVKEIDDGVPVLIGFDEHGDSRNAYTPNSIIQITGEPRVLSPVTSRSTSDNSLHSDSPMIEKSLSSIDPSVQTLVWKSVARIRCEYACGDFMGSAIVVDKDADSLYILTNLHLLGNESDMMKRVGKKFEWEVKDLVKATGHAKKKRPIESDVDVESIDPPRICVDQFQNDTLVFVLEFTLQEEVCWKASATFDYMIFKVPLPESCSLEKCDFSSFYCNAMPVHIFGFPGALVDSSFSHYYAIIPAQVTGKDQKGHLLISTLSTPGLSGSAIVCTKRGVPVGYLGGGFDTDSGNQQYQCYGYAFAGLPDILPRFMNKKRR